MSSLLIRTSVLSVVSVLMLGTGALHAYAQSAPYPYQSSSYQYRLNSTSYDLLGNYVEPGSNTYISGCMSPYDRGCHQQDAYGYGGSSAGYPTTRPSDTYYTRQAPSTYSYQRYVAPRQRYRSSSYSYWYDTSYYNDGYSSYRNYRY